MEKLEDVVEKARSGAGAFGQVRQQGQIRGPEKISTIEILPKLFTRSIKISRHKGMEGRAHYQEDWLQVTKVGKHPWQNIGVELDCPRCCLGSKQQVDAECSGMEAMLTRDRPTFPSSKAKAKTVGGIKHMGQACKVLMLKLSLKLAKAFQALVNAVCHDAGLRKPKKGSKAIIENKFQGGRSGVYGPGCHGSKVRTIGVCESRPKQVGLINNIQIALVDDIGVVPRCMRSMILREDFMGPLHEDKPAL
ncbi:hypothetical protein CALCODRAFT_540329 [Calocera cornea HHB12733]|uniref:Uncharacterized protein n=1 Tax=Calocera cornea HHB12733 TaxID=1353952 RepID=A0A166LC55_9BASI|nr:hypothetical protein CALCODRAFT_540329 [Calocera cornea HHB12733]